MTDSRFDIKGINIPKTKLGQTKMDKLLSSSEELFATKGFYNTSISDICRRYFLHLFWDKNRRVQIPDGEV